MNSNLDIIYGKRNKWYFNRKSKITKQFIEQFYTNPTCFFSSPGRMEVLGNHTDHNNGLVLVSSVDLDIMAAVCIRDDNEFYLKSEGYPINHVTITDLNIKENEYGKSNSLIRGVLYRMRELGYKIGGLNVSTSSRIFKGAGLSSSAAFELLIAEMMNYFFNDSKIDRVTLAQISQFAENKYFNKPSGLLDQMGVSLGGFNYIDFKDTKNPIYENFRLTLKNYRVVLINTGGSHASLTSYYRSIREDMEKVALFFNKTELREVSEKDFNKMIPLLRKKVGGRAVIRSIHFYDENRRVKEAYEALKNNDISAFLKNVKESGNSSYKLLENCFVQKDKKQDLSLCLTLCEKYIKDGAYRVHGGGFKGSVIAFINTKEQIDFIEKMKKVFGERNVLKLGLRGIGTSIIVE